MAWRGLAGAAGDGDGEGEGEGDCQSDGEGEGEGDCQRRGRGLGGGVMDRGRLLSEDLQKTKSAFTVVSSRVYLCVWVH